jgi:hypothetical protein
VLMKPDASLLVCQVIASIDGCRVLLHHFHRSNL